MVLGIDAHSILIVLALIITLEGALCALAPNFMRAVARFGAEMRETTMRVVGMGVFAVGAIILWELI